MTCNVPAWLLVRVLLTGQELQGDAMPSGQNPSRRFTSRVAGLLDLWAFWNCKKHDGLSRVLDLSVGGLCLSIEKSQRIVVGEKVHFNFLVPEGQIRTDAIVRHARPERLGLKFIAISAEDRTQLTALMTRLRNRPPNLREGCLLISTKGNRCLDWIQCPQYDPARRQLLK